MSRDARSKWNEKWRARQKSRPPDELLQLAGPYLSEGIGLDVACGRGQNALWLAEQGYSILGVDVSGVALRAARSEAIDRGLAQRTAFIQVDLDHWRPPRQVLDLVIVFRFLDRVLIPHLRAALRPRGLAVYQTRHVGLLLREPNANRAYLLERGELAAFFPGWEILYSREGPVDAQLIARRPP